MANFEAISDSLEIILKSLNLKDIISFARCSHDIYQNIMRPGFWSYIIKRDYEDYEKFVSSLTDPLQTYKSLYLNTCLISVKAFNREYVPALTNTWAPYDELIYENTMRIKIGGSANYYLNLAKEIIVTEIPRPIDSLQFKCISESGDYSLNSFYIFLKERKEEYREEFNRIFNHDEDHNDLDRFEKFLKYNVSLGGINELTPLSPRKIVSFEFYKYEED